MRRLLLISGGVLVSVAMLMWLATGANRGWTKTSIPVKVVDEVTGLEGIHYQQRFVPGLDFLAAAGLGGVVLAGASLFFRKHQQNKSNRL